MEEMRLDGLSQSEALRGELALSYQRNSELEGQVARTEEQVALFQSRVAEAEERLALLRDEQDAICAEAFLLGEEKMRAKISRAYPDLDLSLVEVESDDGCTPGEEEDEYEEPPDDDSEALLGSSAAAEASSQATPELGEPSHALPDTAEEDLEPGRKS